MPKICVVLVEPKHPCNVGFVARAMKNFGLSSLYFSGNCPAPDKKAFECAAHGRDVLEGAQFLGARRVNDYFDMVVGTTAKPHMKESSPRIALTPTELSRRLQEVEGSVALLFGREDTGLTNKELGTCDIVVSIPANMDYSTLNISHAAAVLFYELTRTEMPSLSGTIRDAKGVEKEALIKRLEALLETIEYPNYKKKVAKGIFRKVIGRAGISAREAHTLAGIFKEAADGIKRKGKEG